MGQAKRRKEAGERISWCRTCTYCCTLPDIAALDKPMYRACQHVANPGCGIFGEPERPAACVAYNCAYLSARLADLPEKNRIPHPLEAGAYFHRDPVEKVIVLFVDPDRPELWKSSGIVPFIRPSIEAGFSLLVIDRGRRMVIANAVLFEAILARDFVAFAETEGRPLDIPAFKEWQKARP